MLTDIITVGIIVFFICLAWNSGSDYDNTDDVENKKRSGLTLYTDHKTGCQYIKGGLFGGLSPRLDKDGNHICIWSK